MNDLNQQELLEIQRCLRHMIEGGVTPYSSLTIDVSQKVNRMLHQTGWEGNQSKCEHEFTFLSGWRCIKCKGVFP